MTATTAMTANCTTITLESPTTTAVIVDLENLLFDSRREGSAAVDRHLRFVWSYLRSRVGVTWSIGSGDAWLTRLAMSTTIDLGIRVRANRIGKNAADALLLRHGQDVPASVSTVVLVSGDADMLPLVLTLQARGVEVIVVSEHDKASWRLRDAADAFWPLATWDMVSETVLAA